MGEYIYRADGEYVKIGTCENMFGLRFDQLDQVAKVNDYNLDPRDPAVWPGIRFRFPFPHEDDRKVGEFEDLDYGVNVPDISTPDVDHSTVQFISNPMGIGNRGGYNAMLPCPSSTRAEELAAAGDLKINRNGGATGVNLVQQRVWNGHLAAVAECAVCGTRFRYPELDDARELLDGLGSASEIAERVCAGYGAQMS